MGSTKVAIIPLFFFFILKKNYPIPRYIKYHAWLKHFLVDQNHG